MLLSKPKHFVNIVIKEMLMYLSTELTYRWQILAWVVADLFQPLILIVLWSVVARSNTTDLTVTQVVSYFFMVIIVSKFTKDWSDQLVSNKIIFGQFSTYLIKPFNYLSEVLGISLAVRILRLVMITPMLIAAGYILKDYFALRLSFEYVMMFFSSLGIGFLISFLLGNIFALLAFFVKQILGLRAFYENTVTFLSGELIPLAVMPTWALFFVEILPFRYTLSFPIEIITDRLTASQIQYGFLLSLGWLFALIVIYKIVYRVALKKYESEGI